MTRRRPPRLLHPGAWWLWAGALAVAASRTTNPLLLILILAAASYVVAARRQQTPWSHSFAVFLRIGAVAIAIRVVLFAFLAPASGAHVLFRLPQLPLPHWLAGLRVGGPVAAEGVVAAAYDGLRLAVILVCVGAANSLTSPRRMLKSLPASLYEAGVALTVAVAFVPQAVASVERVRDARRLRGRSDRGLRSIRGIGLPVLEGALERSVDLAAAMDARGFGRRGTEPAATRRATAALTLTGLATMLSSSYGLLEADAPQWSGLPVLVAGAALTAAGFVIGRRRGGRTRYRADAWRAPEWVVATCGVVVAATYAVGAADGAGSVLQPLAWPTLPLLPAIGVVAAVLPAWLAPRLPGPFAPGEADRRGRPATAARARAAT